ncbi:hypothetical protein [Hymenobacter sp. BRD67]|uniref:hypothetical protein n=1 Tax=Hymenobacter sp. BRD67 TaxID=2675877 RepID=UPI00156321AC|nr:hypothetical protein [Hymenobacter sp. BRD67]QKG51250.1 hypothetical protein GKZ67_18835 [Hymenobacter sp. BRD67]
MKFFPLSLTLLLAVPAAAQTAEPAPGAAPHPAGAPLPVEVMAGHQQLILQTVVNRKFAPDSRFAFFNLTTFGADYHNEPTKNSYLTSAALKVELLPRFSVFGGLNMNSTVGFRPTGGLDYVFTNPTWLVVAEQSVDLTETHNLQSLVLVEFKPQLTERLALYSRVQGLYNYNTQEEAHDLSYLYLRLGLSYRTAGFGLAANLSRFGPFKVLKENYGVFLRKEFF